MESVKRALKTGEREGYGVIGTIGKEIGGSGNQRNDRNHPNYNIIKVG